MVATSAATIDTPLPTSSANATPNILMRRMSDSLCACGAKGPALFREAPRPRAQNAP
jgi:hypothetical protein